MYSQQCYFSTELFSYYGVPDWFYIYVKLEQDFWLALLWDQALNFQNLQRFYIYIMA